jgi:hypothetical protein
MAINVAKEAEELACSTEKLKEIYNKLDEILKLVAEDEPKLQPQPQPLTCPPPENPYPELASLGEYMRHHNLTTLYGVKRNTIFLSNILYGYVPANSQAWHPQTLGQWAEAQIGEAYFGVLVALLARCIDGLLAALAVKNMKIRPTWLSKVKEKFHFFLLLAKAFKIIA